MSDGKIVIDTSIDSNGAERDLSKFQGIVKSGMKATVAIITSIGTAITGVAATAVNLGNEYSKACNKMQISTGATKEQMEGFSDVIKNIYSNNFGESFDDVADAVSQINKNLWLTGDELQTVSQYAITYRDIFDTDINESTRAAKALMDNFGISAKQAFNLLVQGQQNGLDYSGEFIDTVSEYSVQFKKLGLNAEEMFNVLYDGARSGAWNLDKVGDAVKEFSIRVIDGSNTTIDGFKRLGFNADEMAKRFAAGGDVAKDSFYEVIKAIAAMEDPVEQSIVGVDLFGTMWEDLGPQVVTQLATMSDAFNGTVDSAEKLNEIKYSDFGSAISGIGRQLQTNLLLPIAEKVLPSLNEMANKLNEAFNNPEIQDSINSIINSISEFGEKISQVISDYLPKTIECFAWILENSSTIVGAILSISAAITGFKAGAMMTKVIKSWQEAQLALALYKMTAEGAAIKQGVLNGVFSVWETLVALLTGKITLATAATSLWTKAQAVLNGVMSANSIGFIVAGVAALVTGIIYLWNTNEGFRNAVIKSWNAIKETAINVWGAICTFFTETIPKAFNIVIDFVKNNWQNLLLLLVNPFVGAFNLLYDNCDGFRAFIDYLVQKILSTLKTWGENTKHFFIELWNEIITTIKEWGNNISSFFIELWNGVLDTIKQWGDNIKNFFTKTIPKIIQNVVEWFNQLPYMIGYALGYALGTITKWGADAWNYLNENVPIWIESVVTFFSELPGKIWTWLVEAYNKIVQWGSNSWNKIVTTCTNIVNSVTEFFSKLPRVIWDWLSNAFNKIVTWGTDTWNEAIEIGSNFLNSIIQFFSQLPGVIWNWLVNAYNNVVSWGSNMLSKAVEVGSNFINNIINWIKQLPGKISTWLNDTISKVASFASDLGSKALQAGQNMVNNIINSVANLPSKMYEVGVNIVKGVWNGITGMGDWLLKRVSSFFDGIVDGAKKALKICSPSRVFRDQVGKYMAQGVGVGFEDETKNVQKSMESDFEYLVAKMSATVDYETAMTTARVISRNNSLGGVVEESDTNSEKQLIENHIHVNVEGKEVAYAIAPYQDILSEYYEGR